jgi:hypothetical protein
MLTTMTMMSCRTDFLPHYAGCALVACLYRQSPERAHDHAGSKIYIHDYDDHDYDDDDGDGDDNASGLKVLGLYVVGPNRKTNLPP